MVEALRQKVNTGDAGDIAEPRFNVNLSPAKKLVPDDIQADLELLRESMVQKDEFFTRSGAKRS